LGCSSQQPFLDERRVRGRSVRQQLPDRLVGSATVPCIELLDGQGRPWLEDTALGDQAGEAPCGIGASAEPEQEDIVTRLEDLDEPRVGVNDLVIEAVPLDATRDLLPEASTNALAR